MRGLFAFPLYKGHNITDLLSGCFVLGMDPSLFEGNSNVVFLEDSSDKPASGGSLWCLFVRFDKVPLQGATCVNLAQSCSLCSTGCGLPVDLDAEGTITQPCFCL